MRFILKEFGYPNSWVQSSIGLSGGLAVLWKDGFHIEIIQEEVKLISFLLKTDTSVGFWILSCMYGSIQEHEKVLQWSAMENIAFEYQ